MMYFFLLLFIWLATAFFYAVGILNVMPSIYGDIDLFSIILGVWLTTMTYKMNCSARSQLRSLRKDVEGK